MAKKERYVRPFEPMLIDAFKQPDVFFNCPNLVFDDGIQIISPFFSALFLSLEEFALGTGKK